jgi:predicted nucleic acid-binding protein
LIVVSDSSAILNLAAVGRLDLLRVLYSEIVIPPAVEFELSRKGVQKLPG